MTKEMQRILLASVLIFLVVLLQPIYMNWFGIDLNNNDISKMVKSLDEKRFFKLNSNHYDFVIKENMTVSPKDPHPSIEGHTQWAKQLKEFIDANNLRTI